MTATVIVGDALSVLKTLPDESVQCCVTSPPYFGLRDYGHSGQMGLESTPELYVAGMVEVFREVRRVLRNDGTLWINVGDSYAGSGKGAWSRTDIQKEVYVPLPGGAEASMPKVWPGVKPKDLIGIPWALAFALRADCWYLRSEIIWHKPNPMPESVTDRPTKSHEQIFLLAKSQKYFYDADAIAEDSIHAGETVSGSLSVNGPNEKLISQNAHRGKPYLTIAGTRNKRTVWTITTASYSGAHFATFPPKLIEPCILAGSRIGDTVLDPFFGAGTTGVVASRLNRDCIGIELNPEYAAMAEKRIHDDNPLFSATQSCPESP